MEKKTAMVNFHIRFYLIGFVSVIKATNKRRSNAKPKQLYRETLFRQSMNELPYKHYSSRQSKGKKQLRLKPFLSWLIAKFYDHAVFCFVLGHTKQS